MPDDKKVLITIATYNEIENLPTLVDEVFERIGDAHILVIDDNSPDGTGQWCARRSAEDPRFHCLHRPEKMGLGSAIIAGMQYGIENGYQFVINMDADFSHQPRYLCEILGGMGEEGAAAVDVMIGSRYIPGGSIEGWSQLRHWMSFGVNCYARFFLGLVPKDCSGAFRCYRVSALKKLDLGAVKSRGYSFPEEILWRLQRVGAKIKETPILFLDRREGASKINATEAITALWIILRLGIQGGGAMNRGSAKQ